MYERFRFIESAQNKIAFVNSGKLAASNVTKLDFEHAFSGYDFTLSTHSLKNRFSSIDSGTNQVVYTSGGQFQMSISSKGVNKTNLEKAFENYSDQNTGSIHAIKSSLESAESAVNASELSQENNGSTDPQLMFWADSTLTTGTHSSTGARQFDGGGITLSALKRGLSTTEGIEWEQIPNPAYTAQGMGERPYLSNCTECVFEQKLVSQTFNNRHNFTHILKTVC